MFTIAKRTFAAKQHPRGSAERERLNLSSLTSEYMPSYKFVLLEDDKPIPYTFPTRGQAEDKVRELSRRSADDARATQ